jgi:hypothetical protein
VSPARVVPSTPIRREAEMSKKSKKAKKGKKGKKK